MVTLQFPRETNVVSIIDLSSERPNHKQVEVGYLLFSFLDAEIDILGNTVIHPYWIMADVKSYQNMYTATVAQKIFKKIFARIPVGSKMGLPEFEKAMIDYNLEVPIYSVSADSDGCIYDSYHCIHTQESHSIVEQLCTAELYHLVKSGRVVKRCERCGKLFAPKKADEKYCIRRSAEYPDKSCKLAAKYEKQLQRERSSLSAQRYKSINTMLALRAKNATLNEKERLQSELCAFRDEADSWRRRVKSGEAREEEYIDWLNSHKKRKPKGKTAPGACDTEDG